jgi:hypothetical protein
MNVYFAHGKESGPWGTKIDALATVARMKGFCVESPDYFEQPDPDLRVEQLLNQRFPASDLTVLVGSSMGGYVATVASQIVNPVGLFLIAPAFYLSGYKNQSPAPNAKKTVIIHGLKDEVVPVENSIRFSLEHGTELHLIDGDHRLNDQLPKIEMLFDLFLDEVLELSDLPKILTWEKISQKFGQEDDWVARIWEKIASAGHANYRNESERQTALLKFIVLADFYHAFLSDFSLNRWGDELEVTSDSLELPKEVLDNLLANFIERRGNEMNEVPTIQMALNEIARDCIYPAIIGYYGDIERVAASIYSASYPTFFDEYTDEYLLDPENLDIEEIAETEAFTEIIGWLKHRMGVSGETCTIQ